MKKSDVRGVSQILITVIMIGLVLVLIGVVWAVISNLLSQKSEEVSSGADIIGLEIKNVLVNGDGNLSIFVERDAKQGNFAGVKFVISDGVNQYFYERDTAINNLETKIYVLNYSGVIKSIEVAPVYQLSTGETKLGNVIDKFEPSYESSLEGMNGLVSWWKFEGNAYDVFGRNNGTISGATLTTGRIGNGYEFHGVDENYIQIPSSLSLYYITSNLTMNGWIKMPQTITGTKGIIECQGDSAWGYGYDLFYDASSNQAIMRLGWGSYGPVYANSSYLTYTINLKDNQWHQISGVFNKPNTYLFIDGNLVANGTMNYNISSFGSPCVIGALSLPPTYDYAWFNGTIDEVMIFNRSLSTDEVKALYEAQN